MAATATLSAHRADHLLTLTEAAQRLRICVATLRAWTLAGKLPHIKTDRKVFILESDLADFVRSSRIETK